MSEFVSAMELAEARAMQQVRLQGLGFGFDKACSVQQVLANLGRGI
jgi:hypothetical protein